jgi:hypothetical protein
MGIIGPPLCGLKYNRSHRGGTGALWKIGQKNILESVIEVGDFIYSAGLYESIALRLRYLLLPTY